MEVNWLRYPETCVLYWGVFMYVREFLVQYGKICIEIYFVTLQIFDNNKVAGLCKSLFFNFFV